MIGVPRISLVATWRLLPGPLRARLLFWTLLTVVTLVALDWAGAVWLYRAPVVAGWDRLALSAGLTVLALVGAGRIRSMLVACRAERSVLAGELPSVCPKCKGPLDLLMAGPQSVALCTACERAWETSRREIDWP